MSERRATGLLWLHGGIAGLDMVWVIVVALLAAATWFVGRQQERALLETWRRVADQFGLSFGFVGITGR